MLVYGDHWRTVRPQERLADLARLLEPSEPRQDGRHRLTHALVSAGELAQGLADAETEAAGADHPTATQAAAMSLCTAIARRLFCAGTGGRRELAALRARPLPATVRCKLAEGHAFYAVFPEAYAAAARAYAWSAPPLAIGLRTIGLGLAAVVAAVTGGRAMSVRPVGHPFARRIVASEALVEVLRQHIGPFAIVDEGPGLSGSSFGAVADLLESLGIGPDRIVFMPSHPGSPGPQASARHRARWGNAIRLHRTLDDLLEAEPIAEWFADLTGGAFRVEDLSGGQWRCDLPPEAWPPASPAQERRKYRLTGAKGVFLARFAGLGDVGEEKLRRGQALARAGYTPEPLALRRGFLLERWQGGSPPMAVGAQRAVITALPRYLAYRARELPAAAAGASPSELRRMAIHNAGELCGAETAQRLGERLEAAFERARGLRPVWIDGRLHPWEWRLGPDSRPWKTDALDHAAGHDLIGAQDIAWDVAGAGVEYALSPTAMQRLGRRVAAEAGVPVEATAIEAFAICYAAFQGGLWALAEGQSDPTEAARIRRHLRRYVNHLRAAAGLPQDRAWRAPDGSLAGSGAHA